ncbi:hypothetical protein HHI36_017130 [Cryptolaemus montrouzieri]|uniref:Ionotropic glutamate receptor C-terminal domain-containing protein n=1 Tax=Cryptolaemus montrouzieri TaxID=559131 RepID=A0ABD2NLY2_9CUCU
MNSLSSIPNCFVKDLILEVENYNDLHDTFENIKLANCWNQNQKFFISLAAILPDYEIQFKKMIELVVEEKLSNVVIMLPNHSNDSSNDIYYWAEINREKCKPQPKYSKYFSCKFGNIIAFDNQIGNITSATCSLKVRAIVYPPYVILPAGINKNLPNNPVDQISLTGIEVQLMNVISKYLKIKVRYYLSMKDEWGELFFNGSSTNAMKDLLTGKVDITIGSFSINYIKFVIFEMSQQYQEEHVMLCVGYNRYIEFWSSFINLLGLQVLITYVLLTTLIWKITQYCEQEHNRYRHAASSYMYCFAVLIGISVNILPATRKARVFFSLLLIFEIFYVAFYQSFLASLLATAKSEKNINTLNDILDKNIDIYGIPYNLRYLKRIGKGLEDKILKHWIDCYNTVQCLEEVMKTQEKAICIDENYKDYLLHTYIREETPTMYCLSRKLFSYQVAMVMRKTLPIKKQIDDLIGRSLSAGLIHKWSSSVYSHSLSKTYTEPDKLGGTLKFSNLKPIFVLVAVGYLLFCFAFIGELSYNCISIIKIRKI